MLQEHALIKSLKWVFILLVESAPMCWLWIDWRTEGENSNGCDCLLWDKSICLMQAKTVYKRKNDIFEQQQMMAKNLTFISATLY